MIDSPNPTGWTLPSARAFVSHGVTIGIRTNDAALLDRVPECFPTGWEEAAPLAKADAWFGISRAPLDEGRRVLFRLFEDDAPLDEGFRLARLLERMESAIRLRVGLLAPERLFVHAGVVAWNDRCIVLPGRSGAGKTTLVAALVAAGATYCSDEYAVLDDRGYVHPYTRPMSFRMGAHRRVRRCAEADLGASLATGPLPVGLLVHTRFRPLANWAPHPLSSGAGALAMFANTLAARERPAFALSVLSSAMQGVVSLEGDRGEADATAAAILEFVSRTPPPSGRIPQ